MATKMRKNHKLIQWSGDRLHRSGERFRQHKSLFCVPSVPFRGQLLFLGSTGPMGALSVL